MTEAKCKHFTSCGGCSFQDVPYEQQLKNKEKIVHDLFAPFSPQFFPIIPSSSIWHYRNKMEFSFSQNKAQEKFLGLILHRSKGKVFSLEECWIAPVWFVDILKKVRAWWENTSLSAYHFRKGEGALRTLTIREGKRTGDKMVILTVSADPRFSLKKKEIQGFIEAIGDPTISLFLRIQQCLKGSPTQFYEMHLQGKPHLSEEIFVLGKKITFTISPTSFFQTNTEQAEVLYQIALERFSPPKDTKVLDLYAGISSLGLCVASQVEKVVSIENNPYAVFDAKETALQNGISNVDILLGDVGDVLQTLQIPKRESYAIVDPPRPGLSQLATEQLETLLPEKILYISCNPKTQALDLARLPSYRLETIQPVDLAPHTPHIENVAILQLA